MQCLVIYPISTLQGFTTLEGFFQSLTVTEHSKKLVVLIKNLYDVNKVNEERSIPGLRQCMSVFCRTSI